MVLFQEFARAFIQANWGHPVALGEIQAKFAEEHIDILVPLAQRRHFDGNCIKAIVQVFPEFPFPDHLFQVHIGCGDNPDVRMLGFTGAYPYKFPAFQDAQQVCLGILGHFSNFIEKNGSAIVGFEIPLPLAGCSGEGPPFVTE